MAKQRQILANRIDAASRAGFASASFAGAPAPPAIMNRYNASYKRQYQCAFRRGFHSWKKREFSKRTQFEGANLLTIQEICQKPLQKRTH